MQKKIKTNDLDYYKNNKLQPPEFLDNILPLPPLLRTTHSVAQTRSQDILNDAIRVGIVDRADVDAGDYMYADHQDYTKLQQRVAEHKNKKTRKSD